ncbi:MAG: phosphatidate cytidylyltransferase [Actinomycetota bacterium]|nr:phosphatidate cytidylyltransferase [Actinomycetota bacterium]
MTAERHGADAGAPAPKAGRAGRNLPAAIAVGVGLVLMAAASLVFLKHSFVLVVMGAMALGIGELRKALATVGIAMPALPVQLGSLAVLLSAYLVGPDAMVVAVALTVLLTALWRLRGGAAGYVRDVTAGVFAVIYVPFLASFVLLMLRAGDGQWQVATFILVTIASDIGGYASGVFFGRHPMAPTISPKKSWEGFAGSAVTCAVVGWLTVQYLLDGPWWAGVLLGTITVVTATLGDLTESVIKRDLGIKDMSQLLPGHGGLMDRLDSLLATVPFAWMVMHFIV